MKGEIRFGTRVPAEKLADYRYCFFEGKLMMLHRARAIKALGKPLPPKAIVHHVDDSNPDDSPLVICQDQAYHLMLHRRLRVLRAGGNPDTDKWCFRCGKAKPISEFAPCVVKQGRPCRACDTAYAAARRQKRKAG